MTRTGPRKRVDAVYWQGRLKSASDYRAAACDALTLAEPGQNCGPIASQAILSAIAYADAITARKVQAVNQQDHTVVMRLLREALGNQFPDVQERRLRRLLSHKDEVQYGVRTVTLDEARRMVEELAKLAHWAEDLLR